MQLLKDEFDTLSNRNIEVWPSVFGLIRVTLRLVHWIFLLLGTSTSWLIVQDEPAITTSPEALSADCKPEELSPDTQL